MYLMLTRPNMLTSKCLPYNPSKNKTKENLNRLIEINQSIINIVDNTKANFFQKKRKK
jgi:hypothetical protein